MKEKSFQTLLTLLVLQSYSVCAQTIGVTQDKRYESRFRAPAEISHECVQNFAGDYPCTKVDLRGFFDANNMIGSTTDRLSDIWGWTDSVKGREYALVGLQDGTAFVDISIQNEPVYLGFLEAHDNNDSIWRDIKTYGDYAYIVADTNDHGMQIFDLTQLRDIVTVPVMFMETAHYEMRNTGARSPNMFAETFSAFTMKLEGSGVEIPQRTFSDEGYAHNLAINEDSGFAYLIGSNNCNGGLTILDLKNPLLPTFEGCFGEFGWILDAQCVTYKGPDTKYRDDEICFISYYTGVGVVDVSNKSRTRWLSFIEDGDFNQVVQGWLTEDHKYFLVGDRSNGSKLRTHIFDVSDLDSINFDSTFTSSRVARQSNSYVKGDYLYQANHRSGFTMYDISDIDGGEFEEVGFFDTTPVLSESGEDGVLGVYPFFDSGAVILSSVDEGLYIVHPSLSNPSLRPSSSPSISSTKSPSRSPSLRPSMSPSSSMVVNKHCEQNLAGIYPCSHINLDALLRASSMEGTTSESLSDIWGWTDPVTKDEYALVGLRDGTAFVKISIKNRPIYLGFLEAHDNKDSLYRDIKTYGNTAYVVADALDHGIQIFDLTQLRDIEIVPVTFEESAHFELEQETFARPWSRHLQSAFANEELKPLRRGDDIGYVRNMAINEASGIGYLIGSNRCEEGIFMLDLSDPLDPQSAGCFRDWGEIEDAQCVTYDGPDMRYQHKEICFFTYDTGIAVVDVTVMGRPRWLDYLENDSFKEVDQGWLIEDQKYFLVGDRNNGSKLLTHIIDVSDLLDLKLVDTYVSNRIGRPSNSFVKGNYLYQANHRAGLTVLDLSNIVNGELTEVAYFDTTPSLSESGQDGVWGVYPFFDSGAVILSSVDEGLFVVDLDLT